MKVRLQCLASPLQLSQLKKKKQKDKLTVNKYKIFLCDLFHTSMRLIEVGLP